MEKAFLCNREKRPIQKPGLVTVQRLTDWEEPSTSEYSGYSYSTVPAPKAQRMLQKRGQEDC